MKRHKSVQPCASEIEQPIRAEHGLDETVTLDAECWPVDRPIPALLTDADLRLVLHVSSATFYRWKKLGRFQVFLVSPQMSPLHSRYSGALVRAYILGQRQSAGARRAVARYVHAASVAGAGRAR